MRPLYVAAIWIIILAVCAGCTGQATEVVKTDEGVRIEEGEAAAPSPDETALKTEAPSRDLIGKTLTADEQALVNRFYGVWINTEQLDMTMEVQEDVILVGVTFGQLLTESNYVVTEVDLTEQSIVIQGTSLEISYDEEIEERPLSSKVILQQEGNELLYIHDYRDQKIESSWTK